MIAVHPNSYRTVRGKTLLCAIFDEVAIWRDADSALPDIETYRAVLPSLVTTNGMLIGISSPYRKTGLLYQKHRDHFGQDSDDVLVVQAPSRVFNPTLDEQIIAAAISADPEAAIAEWEGGFRSDISSFLGDEIIERAVDYSRPLELPPRVGRRYQVLCGCRPVDDTTPTRSPITHKEGEQLPRRRGARDPPPFDPGEVTRSYAALLQGVSRQRDQWRQLFR